MFFENSIMDSLSFPILFTYINTPSLSFPILFTYINYIYITIWLNWKN